MFYDKIFNLINQLMQWCSGMFLAFDLREAEVNVCKFILFLFGKIGSFKGK